MEWSRRDFTRALATGVAAVPFGVEALRGQSVDDAIELRMKTIAAEVSDARAQQIREFIRQNTMREISVLRAWPVQRDTPPALGLGVFDL